jgi:Tol biopolymer transport system component
MEARLSDIRVLNRGRNTQELITPAYGTTLQDGEALYPKFAQNGRYVVFTSNATNLLPAKRDPVRAAFVHDRYKGMLEVVSRNSSGDLADRPVGNPSISQDGRYVFFKSAATNLLGKLPVSHLGSHLYRFDRWKTQIIRIDDEDRSFDETRWVSGDYAINDDGSLVVFEGRDRDVADFDQQLSATSLFIFDESTGVIHPLLPDEYAGKAHSPAMNADGRFVVFALRPGLAVMDRKSGEIRTVHESECENPVVSGDGRIIVFEAKRFVLNEGKPVLQAPSKPGATNIYLTTNPFN